jgi:lipoprotein-releasing system permease protein
MRNKNFFWLFKILIFPKKHSRYQHKRLINSAILIALVMIPLVLSLLFMDGMINAIIAKYVTLADGHLQIYSNDEKIEQFAQESDVILSSDFVVSSYAIIYSKEVTSEVKIKGVKESYFNQSRDEQLSVEGPYLRKEGSLSSVMISKTLADTLNVKVGERVAFMVVPDRSVSVVRPVLANITSIYHTGYYELDNNLVFMNYEDALRLFGKADNTYQEILVKSTNVNELDKVVDNLKSYLEIDFSWATWDMFNQSVYQNFVTSRQVILVIFLLILVVAAIYVSSIAQEHVQDSIQNIAMLKVLGSTNSFLYYSYFGAVMVTIVIGMSFGITVAILIAKQLSPFLHYISTKEIAALRYYLLDFKLVITYKDILFIFFSMIVISAVTVRLALKRVKTISPLKLLQQD